MIHSTSLFGYIYKEEDEAEAWRFQISRGDKRFLPLDHLPLDMFHLSRVGKTHTRLLGICGTPLGFHKWRDTGGLLRCFLTRRRGRNDGEGEGLLYLERN
jgi:hypothetical protein